MPKLSGLFVTFDGPNCSGKTSLLDGVADKLYQAGFEIHKTKEPTVSPLGEFIRQAEENYNGLTLASLVASDRYFHLEHEVLPALHEGKVVLSDRYVESSLALQRLDGIELETIWAFNCKIYIPDLSVILTAPVKILEERLAQRTSLSRFERTKSRAMELNYYLDAGEFLSIHGFNVLYLDNGDTALDENVTQVYKKIKNLIERSNYGKGKY